MHLKGQNIHVLPSKGANFAPLANAVRKSHLFSGHYLRHLRLNYGITLGALAHAAGISVQHMSRAELQQTPPTHTLERKCETALETLITQRSEATRALERDYRAVKGRLLDFVEEDGHE